MDPPLDYKNQAINATCRKKIIICSVTYTRHRNTLCWQNVLFCGCYPWWYIQWPLNTEGRNEWQDAVVSYIRWVTNEVRTGALILEFYTRNTKGVINVLLRSADFLDVTLSFWPSSSMTLAASLSEPSSPRLRILEAEGWGNEIIENYSSEGIN